jgi:hypothetical protein
MLANTQSKNYILPVVLYGRETWFLTLREKQIEYVLEQGTGENIWAQER